MALWEAFDTERGASQALAWAQNQILHADRTMPAYVASTHDPATSLAQVTCLTSGDHSKPQY